MRRPLPFAKSSSLRIVRSEEGECACCINSASRLFGDLYGASFLFFNFACASP